MVGTLGVENTQKDYTNVVDEIYHLQEQRQAILV